MCDYMLPTTEFSKTHSRTDEQHEWVIYSAKYDNEWVEHNIIHIILFDANLQDLNTEEK